MLATSESTLKIDGGRAPRWAEWLQSSRDAGAALSVLDENPLKGIVGSVGELRSKRALVMGCGAVGGVAASLLSRSGVGFLDLVDPDCYSSTSFVTQPSLYEHCGRSKAVVQGEWAQRINPACRVRAAVCQAQDLLLRDLHSADVLVVAGDNVELLVWAARKALALGKPLVQGAVHGETAAAFVRGFDLQDAVNACPVCGMTGQEFSDQTTRMGCEIGARRASSGEATRTMPAICHAAGTHSASEAIKWLSEQPTLALRGEEFVCSMFAYQTWRTALPRNVHCRLPHVAWDIEHCLTAASQTTLGCLAAQIGLGPFQESLQVRGEIPWVSFTLCGSCQRTVAVQRFARAGSPVGRCPCGAPLATVPQGMRAVVPAADLEVCWQTPLANLGIESGEAVAMLRGDTWVYFLSSEASS